MTADPSYQPKVFRKAGGDELVVASGGQITVESGGEIKLESGGILEVNASNLDVTELAYLDGLTIGTVAASKAVVVDASKDIGTFRNLNAVNIDAGSSGVAGSVDVFPTTASKGKATLAVTDQAGNTAVTLQVDAMGQATSVHFPDPGISASYLVQSTAQITVAEANVLDGATAGTPVASKAVIADANQNIGAIKGTSLAIGTSGAEVALTATPAALNALASAASGLGSSNSYVRTDTGTKTLVAANASKDRGVLVVVTVDTTFANGDGQCPVVTIGETDTANKGMANSVLVNGVTAGTRFVFGFTNTATKAITATLTAATGSTSTGAFSILILALPNS